MPVLVGARHETGSFAGVGGVEIFWQAWHAGDAPRAAIVLAHGAGEHSGRYEHVAAALNERGYSLWALDHRGHGRSGGRRAYVERFDELVADLDRLVDLVAAQTPGQRPVLFGHSMGGCVATGYAIRQSEKIAALVLSNPLATAKTAPLAAAVGRFLSRVAPRVGVYRVPVEGVSRDPEEVRKYVDDPLNFHDKLPARTVAELAREVATFEDGAARIDVPVLVMYSSTDPIVAPSGARMLARRAGSSDVTLRDWPGLLHELVNEPERDQVIAEIADWLDQRVGVAR